MNNHRPSPTEAFLTRVHNLLDEATDADILDIYTRRGLDPHRVAEETRQTLLGVLPMAPIPTVPNHVSATLGNGRGLRSATDEELMEFLQQGTVAAFDELYNRYVLRIQLWFARQLGPTHKDVAEDLTQEVFATLYRRRHFFNPYRCTFVPWFYTIVRNTRVGFFRSAAIFVRNLATDIEEDMPDSLLGHLSNHSILKRLPHAEREILNLLVIEELPAADVAHILNISIDTVYRRKYRALRRLKKAFDRSVVLSGAANREV